MRAQCVSHRVSSKSSRTAIQGSRTPTYLEDSAIPLVVYEEPVPPGVVPLPVHKIRRDLEGELPVGAIVRVEFLKVLELA